MTETAMHDIKQANREARVDARVRRRRRQILAAATNLMQQSGFHAMSMQSVADEAKVSVGLIYQYFGNKEDLLRGVVVDILEDFRDEIPQALALAGEDPVDRLKTAFRACCLVVDAKRAAVNLTYRESKTLTPEGLSQIMALEVETAEPIRAGLPGRRRRRRVPGHRRPAGRPQHAAHRPRLGPQALEPEHAGSPWTSSSTRNSPCCWHPSGFIQPQPRNRAGGFDHFGSRPRPANRWVVNQQDLLPQMVMNDCGR